MNVFILFDVLQINKKDEIPFFIVYSCTIIQAEESHARKKIYIYVQDTLLRIEMKFKEYT